MIPLDVPDSTDLISGMLGELSAFDEQFGYHADGVDLQTATLPDGWQDRLIPIQNQNTNGFVGLCLEVNDLLISKYVAGREKDREFCNAVVKAGLADKDVLNVRLSTMPLDPLIDARIQRWMMADFAEIPD